MDKATAKDMKPTDVLIRARRRFLILDVVLIALSVPWLVYTVYEVSEASSKVSEAESKLSETESKLKEKKKLTDELEGEKKKLEDEISDLQEKRGYLKSIVDEVSKLAERGGPTLSKDIQEAIPPMPLASSAAISAEDAYKIWFDGWKKSKTEPKEAELAYREAIRLKKDYAPPYNSIGVLRMQKKETWDGNDGAVFWLQEAIKYQPNYTLAVANLGWTYIYLGRFGDAIEQCVKALLLAPESEYVAQLQASLQKQNLKCDLADAAKWHHQDAQTQSKLGQSEKAKEAYKKACRLGFSKSCTKLESTP